MHQSPTMRHMESQPDVIHGTKNHGASPRWPHGFLASYWSTFDFVKYGVEVLKANLMLRREVVLHFKLRLYQPHPDFNRFCGFYRTVRV